ncbi:uncharacterized protein LOC130612946 [Hydractinia symbiolongicarpus]|uniref:uncharacterized protein LOC130612946 n=1 Tax=Hydractinia symbiolongicarpus TaxID=13093 RepID=UPI00254F1900|nr:uncharacterized protein LOC130612946 [Hydractinia symbiolongicarpus]
MPRPVPAPRPSRSGTSQQDMDLFERQEVAKTRPQIKSKLNEWREWAVERKRRKKGKEENPYTPIEEAFVGSYKRFKINPDGEKNVRVFLKKVHPIVKRLMKDLLEQKKSLKTQVTLWVRWVRDDLSNKDLSNPESILIWAIIAALNHNLINNHPERISILKKFEGKMGEKNLSGVLSKYNSKHKNRKYYCLNCLNGFLSEQKRDEHFEYCKDNDAAKIQLPEEGSTVKFHNGQYQLKAPFIMYADFEAFTKDLPEEETKCGSSTEKVDKHIPTGFCCYSKFAHGEVSNPLTLYRGEDCVSRFVDHVVSESKRLYNMFPKISMQDLTDEELDGYENATKCHICMGEFSEHDVKVRDHCHFTGKFRGSAHRECNLRYKVPNYIPVVFHNLSGYDAHLFIKELAKQHGEEGISVIVENKENIGFSTDVKVGEYIGKNGETKDKDKKIQLRFIDSFGFMASGLNSLVNNLSDDQCKNLRKFFNDDEQFKIMRRKGTDVILLADIFETFRETCLTNYKLDPSHFYTAPGLAWQACLKKTDVELDLLSDMDMLLFVERGIRGGLCQAVHRHAKANNPYMGEMYNTSEETTYLQYLDANNLYRWAMIQKLPTGGFEWDDASKFIAKLISKLAAENGEYGYLLEVDVIYPRELHDTHNDLPFMPERKVINGVEKLTPCLSDKKNYVIHIRALDQALKHGLILEKVHRLMNNSVFGCYLFLGNTYGHRDVQDQDQTEQANLPRTGDPPSIEDDIADDVPTRFDTSGYDKKDGRPLPLGLNKKIIGLMKDELGGKVMTEFVALRAKNYAYKQLDGKEDKKCKGVKKCVVKKTIGFDDYKRCLFDGVNIYREQITFQSIMHNIHTVKTNKLALNADDDKRIIVDAGIVLSLPLMALALENERRIQDLEDRLDALES